MAQNRAWRPNEFHDRLTLLQRCTLAVAIFLLALLTRFIVLPVEAGLAFLTFYPALVLSFYLCGTGPGLLMALLGAVAGYYFFTPPFWTFGTSSTGRVGVLFFLFSSSLIGLIVHKLHLAMARVQQSEQRYLGMLEDQTEIIARFKTDGTLLYVNDAFCRLFGLARDQVVGKGWQPFPVPEDVPMIERELAAITPDNPVITIENRVMAAHGRIRWAQFNNRGFFNAHGALVEIQSVGRDITARKELEAELQQVLREQGAMLDNDLVGIVKLRGRSIVWKNRAMSRIFGFDRGELIGAQTRLLYPDDESYRALGEEAYPVLKARGTYRTQREMVHKDGGRLWIDISGVLLPGDGSESLWMLADMTELKRQQEQIDHLAHHDVLTGLPNRLLLSDRLEQALSQAERSERLLAVCYLDLDGFKPVNDQFGHEAGDTLLKDMASRMKACVRAHDTVCRIGGDEFVLMLTNLENVEEYEVVLQRVIDAINCPFVVGDGQTASVTASIGITLSPVDSCDTDTLLRHADQAMYRAKRSGRNQVCLYSPDEN